jgi:hypothetical protein
MEIMAVNQFTIQRSISAGHRDAEARRPGTARSQATEEGPQSRNNVCIRTHGMSI